MSGGSFGYLYIRKPEPPLELVRMEEEARKEGNFKGADALRKIIDLFGEIGSHWDDAEEFMRAFEWMRSGDYGADQVVETEGKL